tara:strand:- start:1175 stop:1519 length:345 start_codon:yes stop_codon:yes gene_type:complete
VLNNKPLLNEPGITETHRDYEKYHEIVRYKNFDIAINNMLTSNYIQLNFTQLYMEMVQHFLEHFDEINKNITKAQSETKYEKKELHIGLYKMHAMIDYEFTIKKLANTYSQLKN